jgi:hypothetical protein
MDFLSLGFVFSQFWQILYLLHPDPNSECGSGSRRLIECGSGSETLVARIFKFTKRAAKRAEPFFESNVWGTTEFLTGIYFLFLFSKREVSLIRVVDPNPDLPNSFEIVLLN